MIKHNKTFALHPSIIKTIILEQSGDPCKAIAEYVMNSVDAKATRVDITLSSTHYSISDDGVGFENKQSVIKFFGTFALPREEQETSVYGKFRIGRGQGLALSRTNWKSGRVGMIVDLDGLKDRPDVGYSIYDLDEEYQGCLIEGEFFTPLHQAGFYSSANNFDLCLQSSLEFVEKNIGTKPNLIPDILVNGGARFIRCAEVARLISLLIMVPIPVYLNGYLISNRLKLIEIATDDDQGRYTLYKIPDHSMHAGMVCLNQGVYVNRFNIDTTVIVDFHEQPQLNMARNSIDKHCPLLISAYNKVVNAAWGGVLGGDRYFDSYKNSIIASMGKPLAEGRNLLSALGIPYFNHHILESFLASIELEVLSEQKIKLNLLEFIQDIEKEESISKYYYYQSSLVSLKNSLRGDLSGLSGRIVVLGVNCGSFDTLLATVESLYRLLDCEKKIAQNFMRIEYFKNSSNEQIYPVIKDGAVHLSGYKQTGEKVLAKDQEIIHALNNLAGQVLHFLQLFLNVSDFPLYSPLREGAIPQVCLFKSLSGRDYLEGGKMFLSIRDGDDVYLCANRNQVMLGLKSSFNYELKSSFTYGLVLALLDAGYREDRPLHELHVLRSSLENNLFNDWCFIESLLSLERGFYIAVQGLVKPRFAAKSTFKARAKKMNMISAFVNQHYDGLSDDVEQLIAKIAAKGV